MPCGGVYPLEVSSGRCFFCFKEGARHFYEEFDCYVHALCFVKDLMLPAGEAQLAVIHEHTIILDFGLEKKEEKADGI